MRITLAALLLLGLGCDGSDTGDQAPDGSDGPADNDADPEDSTLDEATADAEPESGDVPDADVDDRCEAGLTWCDYGATCYDLMTEPAACGGCPLPTGEHHCLGAESCQRGECVCVSPAIICGSGDETACTDPLNDSWNCGGCYNYGAGPGVRCVTDTPCCVEGVCVPLVAGECPR